MCLPQDHYIARRRDRSKLFLKRDGDFANPDAKARDIGPVQQDLIFKQIHPVIKADIPGAVANLQINFIFPVKGTADHAALGDPRDVTSRATIFTVAENFDRPDPRVTLAIIIEEALVQCEDTIFHRAGNIDLEAAADLAEAILEHAISGGLA